MAFGCFLVWGSRAPIWAGEMDVMHLLKLLQKKGVITQEEANDLMNEVRSDTKNEKTEIKVGNQRRHERSSQKRGFSTPGFKGV